MDKYKMLSVVPGELRAEGWAFFLGNFFMQ